MIALPNKKLDLRDIDRLTDWVEMCCFESEHLEISRGDIADLLHNSLLLDDDVDVEGTNWDRADAFASEVVGNFRRRRTALGLGYPFVVKSDVIQAETPWTDRFCFTALLAADLGRDYTDLPSVTQSGSLFPRLFEKIVQASLATIFCGASVRFGWPREPGWPTSIVDRIGHLANQMGLESDTTVAKVDAEEKDIGLDVVTRLRFGDEDHGTGVVLTQCATGENWETKTDEPPLDRWKTLIRWESHLIRGLAFPWRRDRNSVKFRRLAREFEGFIFDRHRLISAGNADERLDQASKGLIGSWCEERLRLFPKE